MVEGRRIPIAVAAPEVFSPSANGGVRGGSLEHSGKQALSLLKKKYGAQVQSFMTGKYCRSIIDICYLSNIYLLH